MNSNHISKAEITEKAIPLNRKAQVSQRGLKQLRHALQGTPLASGHLDGFLLYANQLLTNAERRTATRLDVALAIVEFAGREFWFIRGTGGDNHV